MNDIKWVVTDLLSWTLKSSILWFLESHSFDTLKWLFTERVFHVCSISSRGVLDAIGVATVDAYLSTLEFSLEGILPMANDWITPNANPCVNDIKCNLCGSKGTIAIDASNHDLIQEYSDSRASFPHILVSNKIHGRVKGFTYENI